MVVVWSWGWGEEGMPSREKEKNLELWGAGSRSLSGHRSKRCATRSSWLFIDEELTLGEKLRTVSGFIKERKTDVNC